MRKSYFTWSESAIEMLRTYVLEEKIIQAEANFNKGFLTDVRYAILEERAAKVRKYEDQLRAARSASNEPA